MREVEENDHLIWRKFCTFPFPPLVLFIAYSTLLRSPCTIVWNAKTNLNNFPRIHTNCLVWEIPLKKTTFSDKGAFHKIRIERLWLEETDSVIHSYILGWHIVLPSLICNTWKVQPFHKLVYVSRFIQSTCSCIILFFQNNLHRKGSYTDVL